MDISSYNYFFIFSPSLFFPYPYVNNILKKENQAKIPEKIGKEEIENFSLRVFIFFLREICISINNIVSLQSGFKPYPKRGSH